VFKPVKRTTGQGSARIQRLFQVLTILQEAADFDGEKGWRTSGQIAKAMHITTSPHFRGLLDELLGQGVIAVRERAWRKNMVAYEWCIQKRAYTHSDYAGAWDAYFKGEKVLS